MKQIILVSKARQSTEKAKKTEFDQIPDVKGLVLIFKRNEGWQRKLVQLLWKTMWQSLLKKHLLILYNLAIPLLSMSLKKSVCIVTEGRFIECCWQQYPW